MKGCWRCTVIGMGQQVVWLWRVVWEWIGWYVFVLSGYVQALAIYLGCGLFFLWGLQLLSEAVERALDGPLHHWDWHTRWLMRGVILFFSVVLLNIVLLALDRISGGRWWEGSLRVCGRCRSLVFCGWRVRGRLRAFCGADAREGAGWASFARRLRIFLYIRALLYLDAWLYYYFRRGVRRAGMDLVYVWLRDPRAVGELFEEEPRAMYAWLADDPARERAAVLNRALAEFCRSSSVSLGDELRLRFLERVARGSL